MGLFSDPVGHTDAFCMNPNRVFKRNTIFFCLLFFHGAESETREPTARPTRDDTRHAYLAAASQAQAATRAGARTSTFPPRAPLPWLVSLPCRVCAVCRLQSRGSAVRRSCASRAPRDEAPTGVKSTPGLDGPLSVSLSVSLSPLEPDILDACPRRTVAHINDHRKTTRLTGTKTHAQSPPHPALPFCRASRDLTATDWLCSGAVSPTCPAHARRDLSGRDLSDARPHLGPTLLGHTPTTAHHDGP